MQQVTISLYSFKELSEDIQSVVVDRERRLNVEDDTWADEIVEKWEARLESWGFCSPVINFSDLACQGDCACFTCNDIDFDKYTNRLIMQTDSCEQAVWLQSYAMLFNYGMLSADICYDEDSTSGTCTRLRCDISLQSEEVILRINDTLLADIKTCMAKISKAIYNELKAYHDLMIDEAQITHYLVRDNVLFMEDGRTWPLN